jgi:hypothetical protein
MRNTLSMWPSSNFHEAASRPFELLLIAAILAWYVSSRPRRAADVALTIGMVIAALYSTRHIPLFAILCAPIVAEHIGSSLRRFRIPVGLATEDTENTERGSEKQNKEDELLASARRLKGSASASSSVFPVSSVANPKSSILGRLAAGVAAGVALLGLVRYEWRRLPALPAQRWMLYATQLDSFPHAAVEFLRRNPGSGNLFNDAAWGSYCLSRLAPAQKVFIDDRAELYAHNGALEEYPAILNASQPGWIDLLTLHDVDTVLVRPEAPMAGVLAQTPGWSLVYQDPQAVVLRKAP